MMHVLIPSWEDIIMEWMHNPAWWALGVAVLVGTVNGFFNWKNWKRGSKPKIAFRCETPVGRLDPTVFWLRNVGRCEASGVRFLMDAEALKGLPDKFPSEIITRGSKPVWGEWGEPETVTLAPGESAGFTVGFTFPGDTTPTYPSKIVVACDQLRTPVRVELLSSERATAKSFPYRSPFFEDSEH